MSVCERSRLYHISENSRNPISLFGEELTVCKLLTTSECNLEQEINQYSIKERFQEIRKLTVESHAATDPQEPEVGVEVGALVVVEVVEVVVVVGLEVVV